MIKTVCVNMLIKQVQSWSTVICVMYNFQRWGEDEISYCLWILETTNIELLLYVACSSLISHHFILYIVVSRFGDCQFVSWPKPTNNSTPLPQKTKVKSSSLQPQILDSIHQVINQLINLQPPLPHTIHIYTIHRQDSLNIEKITRLW